MSGPAPTPADQDLINQLAAAGYKVTPRELKRWRAEGLLRSPLQKSMGRGRGRASVAYPAEALAQARDIARCMQGKIPMRYVALSFFPQHIPVNAGLVKKGYLALLDEIDGELGSEIEDGDPVDAVAQKQLRRAKRTPLGRSWISRSGAYGARRGSDLEDMLVGLVGLVFEDAQPSENARAAITRIAGAPDEAEEEFLTAIASTTLSNLRSTVETMTTGDLRTARDVFEEMQRYVAEAQSLHARTDAPPSAAGLADIEPVEPVWQAFQILIIATLLRTRCDLSTDISAHRQAASEALRDIELAGDL